MKGRGVRSLVAVFSRIGLIGFGGGSTLIPVVEKEVVQRHGWFDDSEFLRHTVAASITPGALAIKLASAAGLDIAGTRGSFAAPFAVAIPGVLLMLLLLSLSSIVGGSAVAFIERLSVGIFLFIVLVLALYIERVLRAGRRPWTDSAIVLLVFLLTGGPSVRLFLTELTGVPAASLPPVWFGLSAIDIMVAAFFLIFFIGASGNWARRVFGFAAASLYVVLKGKEPLLSIGVPVDIILLGLLSLLVLGAVLFDVRKKRRSKPEIHETDTPVLPDGSTFPPVTFRAVLPVALLFLAVPAVLFAAAFLLYPSLSDPAVVGHASLLRYMLSCVASVGSTFGGGTAYVPVADGLFVQTGFVAPDVFYNQLVSLSNALPGPIMSELAAGVGYRFAFAATGGSLAAAWLVSILGATLTVSVSIFPMLAVLALYERLRSSPRLRVMKRVILPVVCGLLIQTAFSLIDAALALMTKHSGISAPFGVGILAAGFLVLFFVYKRWKPSDITLLAGSAGLGYLLMVFL